ncbi:conserved hypothetical protein [Ricinus communis]|uniref:Uncharacterized protein n=1 Tax=Ricinus communis TaxID=3988 RepID=B9RJ78_RICCO|nr:conserved hypothetical protein [Ricinus communis]
MGFVWPVEKIDGWPPATLKRERQRGKKVFLKEREKGGEEGEDKYVAQTQQTQVRFSILEFQKM